MLTGAPEDSLYDKYQPQARIDSWGNSHLMWGWKDLNSSGVQLFYATDATGTMMAPMLVSDIGSVIDSTGGDFNPFVFNLDPSGAAHVAFVSFTDNQPRLFYTSNKKQHIFDDPLELAAFPASDLYADAYDLAVDSTGRAHIVWLKVQPDPGRLAIMYWNSSFGNGRPWSLQEFPCANCRVGTPQIEIDRHGAQVVFRADSGSIYYSREIDESIFSVVQMLPMPANDPEDVKEGRVDLRLRTALDTAGRLHILAPNYRQEVGHRLYHLYGKGSTFVVDSVEASLDSTVLEFDLTNNGSDVLATIWTRPALGPGNNLRMSYAELHDNGGWKTEHLIPDLDKVAQFAKAFNKLGTSIAAQGDRVVIGGLWLQPRSRGVRQQLMTITRTSLRPKLRYIYPDVAPPGMTVVVEAFAPDAEKGAFGPDGFRPDSVFLELVNPADSQYVVLGPSVVSWDGRLVSTLLFVRSALQLARGPIPVPVAVRVGDRRSEIDTFFVVKPQPIGNNGLLAGGGVLGSGGVMGRRSRRGVLVVDSLYLKSGRFTVSTEDTDSLTPGNQGFLPVTILSRGPIRIGEGAELSVSAPKGVDVWKQTWGTAGPGGGGGGSGGGSISGGSGYTAGGGSKDGIDGSLVDDARGSGGSVSSRWVAGPGLSGVQGGAAFPNAAAGGGTGHPFGASGSFGQVQEFVPRLKNVGGIGGASAGGNSYRINVAPTAGGGGGYATQGESGNTEFDNQNSANNGGRVVGSRSLVPLAGGSGGGGGGGYGNDTHGGNGGGGGGALSLFSSSTIAVEGRLTADGGDGETVTGATRSGGGGSGGAILLGAKGEISLPEPLSNGTVSAIGGQGGGTMAGDGGIGRIRVDGRYDGERGLAVFTPQPHYIGAAGVRDNALQSIRGEVVEGIGQPGSKLRIFTRTDRLGWNYGNPYETTVRGDGVWTMPLGPNADSGKIYIAVLQQGAGFGASEFTNEPEWVMSPAGANVLGRAGIDVTDQLPFSCIQFRGCDSLELPITNNGYISDLRVEGVRIIGSDGEVYQATPSTLVIPPGEARTVKVFFCPADTGTYVAEMELETNVFPEGTRTIRLEGCATTGELEASARALDLGALCEQDCRDTTLMLTNQGEAPLKITSVEANQAVIDVTTVNPNIFPLVIQPGSTQPLALRFCLKAFDVDVPFVLKNNTIDTLYRITVRGANAGPVVEMPDAVDFGKVTLSEPGEICREKTVFIHNRNPNAALKLGSITLSDDRFELVGPPAEGTLVQPGDSVPLIVRFCTDQPGDFSALVEFYFGDPGCAASGELGLTARALKPAPSPEVFTPEPQRLTFDPALVETKTDVQKVLLKNLGDAPTNVNLLLRTDVGVFDIQVLEAQTGRLLDAGETLEYTVALKPRAEGALAGVLIFESTEGWKDSVEVLGVGIRPAVQLGVTRIDFRDVRVGETIDSTIVIVNSGTAPDQVTSLQTTGASAFAAVPDPGQGRTIPAELMPAGSGLETLEVRISFAPDAEGAFSGNVAVLTGLSGELNVEVVGRGVLEHVQGTPDRIDFGCRVPGDQVDSLEAFRLANTGTHDLTITGFRIDGDNPDAFDVPNVTFPHVLEPGEERFYTVRYFAGNGISTAQMTVEGSAEEAVVIQLSGRSCGGGDDRRIILQLPTATHAQVGDQIVVPVYVELTEPLAEETPYTFRLTYGRHLLVPRVAPRPDAVPPLVDGTVSADAHLEAQDDGLWVRGSIAAGSTSGMLVGIPMTVLQGSPMQTDLAIDEIWVDAPLFKTYSVGGTLYAEDCDTGRAVTVLGSYALRQNRPNPVDGRTIIHYEIARPAPVLLNLYDGMGNLVTTLVDEEQDSGSYELDLDLSYLPSGTYLYELRSGRFRKTLRMVVRE